MANHPKVLTRSLTALRTSGRPVPVIARYDARDPLVLRFTFTRGPAWECSRQLLTEALTRASAGVGDVQLRIDGSGVECLWLVLDNGRGYAEFLFPVDELTDLAAQLEHLVPGDGSPIDGDAAQRTLTEWGR